MALSPGTVAPDFSLKTTPDQSVSLSAFKGVPLILVFYPADWSPVCTDELSLFNELLPVFKKYEGAELLAISVDGVWCHFSYVQNRKLKMPLLSDFEPKGRVGELYGVYNKKDGTNERALFVIDSEGIIQWSHVSPAGINPGADGILEALENLTKKKVKQKVR